MNASAISHQCSERLTSSGVRTVACVEDNDGATDIAVMFLPARLAVVRCVEHVSHEDHSALATMISEGDFIYFDIDFTNRIGTPAAVTAALRDPRGLESVFFRNPSRAMIDAYLAIPDTINGAMPADGVEVIFDSRLTNLASLRVRGVDLGASYRRTAGPGTIMAQASVSGLLQFERTAQAGAAGIDVLNTLFNPIDWRGRASVTWLQSNWSAAAALNYVDDYRETQAANARRIKSWTSVDLRLSYDFRAESAGPGTRLTFNVQNVFDRDPPFANNSAGYGFDSANFSPVGRFASIELRRTW